MTGMHGLVWIGLLIVYYAGAVLAAGNTTCLSGQLDWYTSAVGETPCMTYQRLRQICNADYEVGNFTATAPGDHCNDQVADCCCNSVAYALSMLCMNCQLDADPGNIAGFDAAPGVYTAYLSWNGGVCSPITNQSLPTNVQQAVCNENIKIDNFMYNRSYWSDGSWFYRWTVEYAQEQQAANNNNTFTVCPNQVSPSASLPTSTSIPTAIFTGTSTTSAVSSSSENITSSTSSSAQGAIIGGAVGGAALIIAVLVGVFCYRRHKRPRMTQDMPSAFLGRYPGDQPVYGASFTDTEPVATQRYSIFSPVRGNHGSRESALPLTHSLSPGRAQSLDTSAGAPYLVNDSVSEAAPSSREADAGTLIPPDDAPAERLPPAYHPSWVSRNTPPRNLGPSEDQVLLDQTVQTIWPRNGIRPGSLTGVPQEKMTSRWSTGS